MRFLIVSQYFHPEVFRINDLAKTLKSYGHQVEVLTGQPNYPKGKIFPGYSFWKIQKQEWEGVTIYRTPLFPRGPGGAVRLSLNYLSFVIFATLFGAIRLKKYDFSLVFATSPITAALPAIFHKWRTDTPVGIWIQDLWPESVSAVGMVKSSLFVECIGRLVRWIYKRSDFLFIQSPRFQSSVEKWGGRSSQIKYFPNWAEDFYLNDSNYQCEDMSLFDNKITLLFAGNIGKAQSLDLLVKAADELKSEAQLRWVFIGDGSEKKWLKREVVKRRLTAQVFLLDRKPAEQIPAYYQKATALLVSLKKDPIFELTIPSKVQSCLTAGKPIIGSLDGAGAQVLLNSGSALVSDAEDLKGFVNNIKKLLQMTDINREELGQSGKTFFQQNFAKDRVIQGFLKDLNH